MKKHTPQDAPAEAVRLLKHYGMSLRGVARALEINHEAVAAAMRLGEQHAAAPDTVQRIRSHCEKVLAAAGWDGDPAELWAEYDRALRKAA